MQCNAMRHIVYRYDMSLLWEKDPYASSEDETVSICFNFLLLTLGLMTCYASQCLILI